MSNPDTLIAAYYETAIRETAVIQAAMFYLRNRMEGNATSVELAGRRAGVSRWSVYRGLSKLEQIITRRAASANQQENSNEPH